MMLRSFQRPMVQVVSILFLMVATTGARAQNAIQTFHRSSMSITMRWIARTAAPSSPYVSKYIKIDAP